MRSDSSKSIFIPANLPLEVSGSIPISVVNRITIFTKNKKGHFLSRISARMLDTNWKETVMFT